MFCFKTSFYFYFNKKKYSTQPQNIIKKNRKNTKNLNTFISSKQISNYHFKLVQIIFSLFDSVHVSYFDDDLKYSEHFYLRE